MSLIELLLYFVTTVLISYIRFDPLVHSYYKIILNYFILILMSVHHLFVTLHVFITLLVLFFLHNSCAFRT